jgi:inorganic triphosphatase YgiF
MEAEVEAKFRASGPEPLAALARVPSLGAATLGPPRVVDEVDRYLDTDDHRLALAGWACRLRDRQGAIRISLKGPATAAPQAGIHRRPEIEGPATAATDPARWPEGPAVSLLNRLREGQPLLERLRLEQHRTVRDVRLDGDLLGQLSLDEVAIIGGHRRAGTLFAVELELEAAGTLSMASLSELAAHLAAWPGLVADDRTKLEHAIERLEG